MILYELAFKMVANHYNVVLGLRSPNPLSFSLLKDGFPSKNFHVKAKSSPTGPTAGFITEAPKYSKTPPYLKQKHIHHINEAKAKGAQSVNLIISDARKKELMENKNISFCGGEKYSSYYPSGLLYFYINNEGHVFDEQHDPIKVITNPPEVGEYHINKKPITADYDLFTIIPSKNQAYNVRPLKLPPILHRGHFNLDFLSPMSVYNNREDVNKGNIHFFGETIVDALNKEIKKLGYTGGKLIWHNDETGNPFSPGFDVGDKPIFYLPTGDVFIATSKVILKNFYSRLKSEGYEPEYNPRFGF